MATRTWETVELPILEAVVALQDRPRRPVMMADVAAATCLPDLEVSNGVHRLAEAGYLTGKRLRMTGLPFALAGIRATEPALRATDAWPSLDPYAELLAVLQIRIEAATDPEARTRLEQLRATVVDVGRDVITGVITALATSAIPR